MTDYLIVGCGLAGIAFAEAAINAGRTVIVYDNSSTRSSHVAAGIYNPVILKRFSGLANAQEHLDEMNFFYGKLQAKLSSVFLKNMPLYRKFASVEEQNLWFDAMDKPLLKGFLHSEIQHTDFPFVHAPHGFGEVLQTGYVNTAQLINSYKGYLAEKRILISESLYYDQLEVSPLQIEYQGTTFRNVIFAEGFGIRSNPYFNFLPLNGTKGELLIIEAPELSIEVIINSSIFILPIGNHRYKVGATYQWDDKTEIPTEEARKELLAKLSDTITCSFSVVDHLAGIRPTVKDRKPLIGSHPLHSNLHLLNGLGTRGVMLAPAVTKMLFRNIEQGEPIPDSYNLNRFL